MTDEQLATIRGRMDERPLLSFEGLVENERERVRHAFRDRRILLAEVERLEAERTVLINALRDCMDALEHASLAIPALAGCEQRQAANRAISAAFKVLLSTT